MGAKWSPSASALLLVLSLAGCAASPMEQGGLEGSAGLSASASAADRAAFEDKLFVFYVGNLMAGTCPEVVVDEAGSQQVQADVLELARKGAGRVMDDPGGYVETPQFETRFRSYMFANPEVVAAHDGAGAFLCAMADKEVDQDTPIGRMIRRP